MSSTMKQTLFVDNKDDSTIAKEAFAKCREKVEYKNNRLVRSAVQLREWNFLPFCVKEIGDLVNINVLDMQHFSEVKDYGKTLFTSVSVRLALHQMVQVCVSIIDTCFFSKIELFGEMGCIGPTSVIQFLMSEYFIRWWMSSDNFYLLSQHLVVCSFILAAYFKYARKPEKDATNEEYDFVSATVDLCIVKLIIEEQSEVINRDFRREFSKLVNRKNKLYRLHPEDEFAELKALLILVSIAMMNVSDVSDSLEEETFELIPFLQEVMQDDYFSASLGALSALLLNLSEAFVSMDQYF